MNPLKQAECFIYGMTPGTWYSFMKLDFVSELIKLIDSNFDGQYGFEFSEFEDQIRKVKISIYSLSLNNFKIMELNSTPIEDILFRSSKIGLLAGGFVRFGLTDKQREEKEKLLAITETVIGLSDPQSIMLADLDNKVKEGKVLTPSQMEKRDDFRSRLTTPRKLTPSQEAKLQELTEKENRPPELSQGAKTYIKDVWLWHEKGFKEEITSKHTRKGIQAEEDALNLISFVDNIMYVKNEDRIRKGNLVGECDAVIEMNVEGYGIVKVVNDTKCSWNPHTFMMADLSTIYEWQGRAYMYLYNADVFRLRYCLVDCPPDVYRDEMKKFCWANNITDESLPEYADMIEQFNANFLYEKSGRYNQKERVKTYMIERDPDLEAIMLKSIQLATEYYQTISLNMV